MSTLFSNVCVCFLHFGGKMRFAGDGTVRVITFFSSRFANRVPWYCFLRSHKKRKITSRNNYMKIRHTLLYQVVSGAYCGTSLPPSRLTLSWCVWMQLLEPCSLSGACSNACPLLLLPAVLLASLCGVSTTQAGVEDCYTSSRGHTRTLGNFVKAVYFALAKTYGYLSPELWTPTLFQVGFGAVVVRQVWSGVSW